MIGQHIYSLLAQSVGTRKVFRYFKDRYALMLLGYVIGDGAHVSDLKRTPMRSLLEKPAVKEATARAAQGRLTRDLLGSVWNPQMVNYVVTGGTWGIGDSLGSWRWHQLSRPGGNLVLHLNFSNEHEQQLRRFLRTDEESPFSRNCHPSSHARRTMAWARLDIDIQGGEALIEEIQNDWIRDALAYREPAERYLPLEDGAERFAASTSISTCSPRAFLNYLDAAVEPHAAVWSEAMLMTAIEYLVEELGITRIFYHTFEGGNLLKGLVGCQPPRSLYTALPRRLCFEETDTWPQFLRDTYQRRSPRIGTARIPKAQRRACASARFWLLDLARMRAQLPGREDDA